MIPSLLQYTYILTIIFIFASNTVHAGSCPTSSIIDAGIFSRDLQQMKKTLGGHTDVDLWFPMYKKESGLGQVVISCTCDLECYDFDSVLTRSCRWRQEAQSCRSELSFVRMRGRWDEAQGSLLFAKKDAPDGFFLLVGSDKLLPPQQSALLVSDPIQCQEGDGIVRFRHWTSPGVHVRVCIRRPSQGNRFDWCSENVKRNGTREAEVVIPGTVSYMFEIVLEVSNFVLDLFGKKGGVAAIDDLSYNASAIYNCKMIPHHEPLAPLSPAACVALQCDFTSQSACKRKTKGSGWKTSKKAVGSKLSGIQRPIKGDFAYVRGPGTYGLVLGPFTLSRSFAVEFCYLVSSIKSRLRVYVEKDGAEREMVFESREIGRRPDWLCDDVMLSNGTYNYIEFSAEKLRNEYSYVAIDEIAIIDPLKGVSACDGSSRTGTSAKLP